MDSIRSLNERWSPGEQLSNLGAFGIIVIVSLLTINVIMKNFLGSSLLWASEISQIIHIWIVLLLLDEVEAEDRHIEVSYFYDKLTGRVATITYAAIKLTNVLAAILIVYSTYLAIQVVGGGTTAATDLPFWILYLPVAIGFIPLGIRYLGDFLEVFASD